MTSESQRNRGYLLPETIIPASTICVQFDMPYDPLYIMAVTGALSELGRWWNWEKDGTTRASEAALLMRNTIMNTLKFNDCGLPQIGANVAFRHLPAQNFTSSQIITGATWQDLPNSEVAIPNVASDFRIEARMFGRRTSTGGDDSLELRVVTRSGSISSDDEIREIKQWTTQGDVALCYAWSVIHNAAPDGENDYEAIVQYRLPNGGSWIITGESGIEYEIIDIGVTSVTPEEIDAVIVETNYYTTINTEINALGSSITSINENIVIIASDLDDINNAITALEAQDTVLAGDIANVASDIDDIKAKLDGLLNLGYRALHDTGTIIGSAYALDSGSYSAGNDALLPALQLGFAIVDAYRATPPLEYNGLWCVGIHITKTDTPEFVAMAFQLDCLRGEAFQYAEIAEGDESALIIIRALASDTTLDLQFLVSEINGNTDWKIDAISWYFSDIETGLMAEI